MGDTFRHWLEGERMTELCREFGISRRPANGLWCADFKGELMLADERHCYH